MRIQTPARTQASTDITHTTLSVIFLVFLVALTVSVISPFLTSMLWATIVSVATWPVLLRLQAAAGGRRGLAVAIVSMAILLVVFVPVTLALGTIVRNAQHLTEEIKSLESIALPAPPAVLEDVPLGSLGGRRIAGEWRRVAAMSPEERSAALAPYVQSALQWFAAKAGSVGSMLLQFVLTTIITAIVLARGETVRDGILRFARRLAGQQGYDATIRAAQAIRGVVLGVVVTALVQSAIGGAGLAISGIPAAPLLAAVMLFLCLAQLGPLPVLAPAVIWLYWSGQSGLGTLLLILGVVTMALDNVVRPLLIRRGASLPLLLIFTGVIGGLIAMGIIGLFIGPVVLTVAYTLLVKWVADDDAAALGEVAANEAVARQAG
jgi:predicted PurR-regulated permease PerM